MPSDMQSLLIGIAAGAAGYIIVTFWFQPILRYREIRQHVHSDLIFFADVTNANNLSKRMQERMWERVYANRRHSSDLRALLVDLPCLYRRILSLYGHNLEKGAIELIGLSNTFEHDEAAKRMEKIRAYLKLPESS
ncbi:hypothetical protein D3C84_704510 [compost metagenome]